MVVELAPPQEACPTFRHSMTNSRFGALPRTPQNTLWFVPGNGIQIIPEWRHQRTEVWRGDGFVEKCGKGTGKTHSPITMDKQVRKASLTKVDGKWGRNAGRGVVTELQIRAGDRPPGKRRRSVSVVGKYLHRHYLATRKGQRIGAYGYRPPLAGIDTVPGCLITSRAIVLQSHRLPPWLDRNSGIAIGGGTVDMQYREGHPGLYHCTYRVASGFEAGSAGALTQRKEPRAFSRLPVMVV